MYRSCVSRLRPGLPGTQAASNWSCAYLGSEHVRTLDLDQLLRGVVEAEDGVCLLVRDLTVDMGCWRLVGPVWLAQQADGEWA